MTETKLFHWEMVSQLNHRRPGQQHLQIALESEFLGPLGLFLSVSIAYHHLVDWLLSLRQFFHKGNLGPQITSSKPCNQKRKRSSQKLPGGDFNRSNLRHGHRPQSITVIGSIANLLFQLCHSYRKFIHFIVDSGATLI